MPAKSRIKHDEKPVTPEGTPPDYVPGRDEIAAQAQAMMPKALQRLAMILQTSGSDLAVLQAFRALKDTAYGKDPMAIGGAQDFESLTNDELKDAIKAELGADFTTRHIDVDGAAPPPPAGEFDGLV